MSAATPIERGGRRSDGALPSGRQSLALRSVPRTLLHGAAGFVFGVVVLHPVAMVIFHRLDGAGGPTGAGVAVAELVGAVAHSFHPHMLLMGILFGLFAALVAGCDGAYRAQRAREQVQILELERSHRRTTRFLVHDFKTHLGVISGFSELLLERVGDRHEREALERIHRQARRMREAVQDLLELERLTTRPTLDRELSAPAELLAEVVADTAGPSTEHRLRLGPHHGACPPLALDRRLVRRVLTNLAANALRHGGAEAVVTLDAEPLAGGGVRYTCRDTGPGVTPDREKELFEEFAHGADRGSTGLGLAFCRAAVAAHGGRLGYHNDGGACFTVDLPGPEEDIDGHESTCR